MEKERKEVSMEELALLLKSQAGDFIIHVEPGEGERYGDSKAEPLPA